MSPKYSEDNNVLNSSATSEAALPLNKGELREAKVVQNIRSKVQEEGMTITLFI